MGLKIRTDDEVIVISGKDRGKTGKVLRVDPKKERVVVEGVNIVKRHQRPLPNAPQIEAGVIEREGPIHGSNVKTFNPKTKKGARVGGPREGASRNRVTKASGAKLD